MAPHLGFDRRKLEILAWDDQLTPLEIAASLNADPQMPFAIAPLLRSGEAPVEYRRQPWSEDAACYTSGKGAKGLIVAFCGFRARLGVPISYFLQCLRDDAFDVVILWDPRQLHYAQGVRGLGDFVETIARIRCFAEANRYERVLTFGNSMGGLPALRAGRLLGAHRAFSLGGRFPWHPGRLMRGEEPVPAFDPLCECSAPSSTELVSIYARRNAIDAIATERLRRTFPHCVEVPIDTDEHNLPGYFYRSHLLPLFFDGLFEHWDETPLRHDLLNRLDQAARQIVSQTSSEDRLSREQGPAARHAERAAKAAHRREVAEQKTRHALAKLQAIRQSRTWRLTAPFRSIARWLFRRRRSRPA